jgi:2-polyprenyl-3-methyl-5-hydroxy-6-metoxy-1,4-benzoquinol methylase
MSWEYTFREELKRQGSLLVYYTSVLIQNWYFVRKIQQYLSDNKSPNICEAGAGTGFLSIYFASLGYKVFSLDIDTRFIEEANLFFKSNISIIQQDIRIFPYHFNLHFNLIYNIGVMEHFNDEDIIKIFKNFRSLADMFIFAVPNFKIPYSYGDERYLSKRHWQKFLKETNWKVKKTFSYNRYGLRNYLSAFVCI